MPSTVKLLPALINYSIGAWRSKVILSESLQFTTWEKARRQHPVKPSWKSCRHLFVFPVFVFNLIMAY